jgi:hypothetical protein
MIAEGADSSESLRLRRLASRNADQETNDNVARIAFNNRSVRVSVCIQLRKEAP